MIIKFDLFLNSWIKERILCSHLQIITLIIMYNMMYISYIRVSTQRQSRSGLGLEAQTEMIKRFIKNDDEIVGSYVEVESGKRKDRPQLKLAIETAQRYGAKLLIAKIDRLARNVSFVSELMEAGIEFTAVDLPEANRFTIQLMAALAEQEARMISERTKAALAQARKRGVKLGKPENLSVSAKMKGREAMQSNAFNDRHNQRAGHITVLLRKENKSFAKIAKFLNEQGYKTRRNKEFASSQVQSLFHRYKSHFIIN